MYPSVAAAFVPFSIQLEGEVPFLYLDGLGYVTSGIGNLADPVGLALAMPFHNADGSASSAADITAAWNAVDAERSDPKGQRQTSGLATHYGQAFGGVTSLRLDQAGIDGLVARQLAADEAVLRRYFPHWDSLPADAQMGILSMDWAMGAGFPAKTNPDGSRMFGAFVDAVNAEDFDTADAHSAFSGLGIGTRVAANHVMFQNAAQVVDQGLDRSVLHYPERVAAPAAGFWAGFLGGLFGGALGLVGGLAAAKAMRRHHG